MFGYGKTVLILLPQRGLRPAMHLGRGRSRVRQGDARLASGTVTCLIVPLLIPWSPSRLRHGRHAILSSGFVFPLGGLDLVPQPGEVMRPENVHDGAIAPDRDPLGATPDVFKRPSVPVLADKAREAGVTIHASHRSPARCRDERRVPGRM